jgi:TetR/AcrR family transcriptional repressor of mexJK operon
MRPCGAAATTKAASCNIRDAAQTLDPEQIMTTEASAPKLRARKAPAAKPATRRARRRSLSNEEFLDKALDLFLEQGFDRTSIEAITAAVGMSKRTVYLRYGDKASLFKAALQRAIDEWVIPVDRLEAMETVDLEQTLQAIGQVLVDNILSPAGLRLLRLTNAVSLHMPEFGAYSVERGSDRTLSYLAGLLRRHLERDSEADDAAEAFLHLVVGGPANAAAWGVVRDKAAIDRRTRYSVSLFLHGLLVGRGGEEPAQAAVGDGENQRLKRLLGEAMLQLDQALEQLEAAGERSDDARANPFRLRSGGA